ncbi:MAG: hypothetical protein L6R39_003860, partial [Caloplaca ligustica]
VGDSEEVAVRGVINDIDVFERGERGKDGLRVVVATGKEHRFGRWKTHKGKNGAVVFEVPPKLASEPAMNGVKSAEADGRETQEKEL